MHVIDASGQEGRDPVEDFHKINDELKQYSNKLSGKEQIIVLNKMELPEAINNAERIKKEFSEKYEIIQVSAATGSGLDFLKKRAYERLLEIEEEIEFVDEEAVESFLDKKERDTILVTKEDGYYSCLLYTSSFTTAYSDLKLSRKAQEITADYYYIHGMAEEKLAEISDVLHGIDGTKDKINMFKKLSEIDGVLVDEENSRISYEAAGQKNQKINVTLNLIYGDRLYYEIESWNLSNIDLPVYEDDIIDLWEGIE